MGADGVASECFTGAKRERERERPLKAQGSRVSVRKGADLGYAARGHCKMPWGVSGTEDPLFSNAHAQVSFPGFFVIS